MASVLLLSCAVAAACAGQSADSGQRLASLEGRLSRLEKLLAPDAASASDASLDEASATVSDGDASSIAVRETSDASHEATTPLADCKSAAEHQCAERVWMDRVGQQRARDGGLRWVQTEPRPRADSTPAGRACLQRELKQCEQVGRREPTFDWLDAQLVPGKKDVTLTNEIRTRIAKLTGVPVDSLDVQCAIQFCRLGPNTLAFDAGTEALGDGFSRYMMDGQTWYAVRRGYQVLK